MIFDTHAHYDDEAFNEDRDAVLRSLAEHGIEAVVNVGASNEKYTGADEKVSVRIRCSWCASKRNCRAE